MVRDFEGRSYLIRRKAIGVPLSLESAFYFTQRCIRAGSGSSEAYQWEQAIFSLEVDPLLKGFGGFSGLMGGQNEFMDEREITARAVAIGIQCRFERGALVLSMELPTRFGQNVYTIMQLLP